MPKQDTLQDSKTRRKAFLVHLCISIGLLLCALAIIFYFWYPQKFIYLGGLEGLAILAMVMLVLGPVLTLVAFNPGKKTILIKLDVVLIGLAQLAAMGFGLWMIYQQRPVVQVLADDGVHVHAASELSNYHMRPSDLGLPDNSPHHVVLDLPADLSQVDELKLIHELINKKPYTLSDELMIPAEDYGTDAIENRVALIQSHLTESQRQFIATLDDTSDCNWLPLFSIHAEGYGCYSETGGIVRIARLPRS